MFLVQVMPHPDCVKYRKIYFRKNGIGKNKNEMGKYVACVVTVGVKCINL